MFPTPVRTGVQTVADGNLVQLRGSKSGELITGDGHARYQEAVYRGNVFSAANQAAISTPAGLTASSLNFTLYNPASSGKNLVVLRASVAVNAAPAAASVIWLVVNVVAAQAAPATNTALTIRNALLGGGFAAAGVGLVYSTTTLAAAPLVDRVLGFVSAASLVGVATLSEEFAGDLIVAPGAYISIQASTAISLQCSMRWEEIPV